MNKLKRSNFWVDLATARPRNTYDSPVLDRKVLTTMTDCCLYSLFSLYCLLTITQQLPTNIVAHRNRFVVVSMVQIELSARPSSALYYAHDAPAMGDNDSSLLTTLARRKAYGNRKTENGSRSLDSGIETVEFPNVISCSCHTLRRSIYPNRKGTNRDKCSAVFRKEESVGRHDLFPPWRKEGYCILMD